MKKDNIRTLAFLTLITVSLFSYSYLSCVSQNTTSDSSNVRMEEQNEVNQIYVPDISLIKKLINLGTIVIGR